MSDLERWYRRPAMDIADARRQQETNAWEQLRASARTGDGGNYVLTGSDGDDRLQPTPAGRGTKTVTNVDDIDSSRTNVFREGPDGKLHPIEGWRTTGPWDPEAWSHNIDWKGVVQDLLTIVSRSIVGAGLPGLASKRGIVGAVGDGIAPADKLTLGAGVYVAGDATARDLAPRTKPKHW